MSDTGINMGGLLIETGSPPAGTPALQEGATGKQRIELPSKELPSRPRAVPTLQTLYSANWKNVRLEGLSRVTAFNSVRTVTRTGHGLGLRNS